MADSDDPCDDVVGESLTGWIKSDSSGSSETNIRQRLERDYRDRRTNSWTRFEHG
jgi:hypothetical protein